MERRTITVDISPSYGLVQTLNVPIFGAGVLLGVYIVKGENNVDCSGLSPVLEIKTPFGERFLVNADVDPEEHNLICWAETKGESQFEGINDVKLSFSDDKVEPVFFHEKVQSLHNSDLKREDYQ